MFNIKRGKSLEILRQLRDHGESYGLEMVKRSGGTLKRGTVYIVLSQLTDEGMIRDRVAPGHEKSKLPRRLYELASEGRRHLAASEAARKAYAGELGIEAVA